jgi:tetratricopeptide (TPR) repeat protein
MKFAGTAALLAVSAWAFAQDPAADAEAARQAMISGKYMQAVEIYSRLSAAFPRNLDVRRNLALALHSAGRYSEALRCFNSVLQQAPQDKAALLFSGIELSNLHEPAKAISSLTKFLQEDSASPSGLLVRGEAYLSLGEFDSAVADFRKAAELEPANAKAWEGLGKAYLLSAQRAFEFVEEHGPFSAEWYGLLARSYASAGDYKLAFHFYREAESVAPDLPGVHVGLAEVYRQTNHPDWAGVESARENRETVVSGTELRRKYLDALDFQQHAAEALNRLAQSPETPEYHDLLGLEYRVQRRDADSVAEFRRALALSPNSLTIKLELAESLAVSKDCSGAVPLLQEVLKADPQSAEANHAMGECLVDQNRPQEAILFLREALKQNPRLLPAQLAIGRAYLHCGDYRNAVIHLERASALGDPSTLYQLSQAYGKLGDQKASAEYLAKYKVRAGEVHRGNESPVKEITPPE